MRHSLLADTMIILKNAEMVGKNKCIVPRSDLVKSVLAVLEKDGYISKMKISKNDITVSLNGKINNTRAIVPRMSCKYTDFEKFEKRYLPTKDIGSIVISTSKGVMSHREAKESKIGGKLLAFVY